MGLLMYTLGVAKQESIVYQEKLNRCHLVGFYLPIFFGLRVGCF